MSAQRKPSIVFCHGLWADGSCFSKVIAPLQADGHQVIAAQYGLDTPEGDVATVIRTLSRVDSPAILVGHSYGGSVITAAGTDDRVAGLVYIAALAPDADETSQSLLDQFPTTDVGHTRIALRGSSGRAARWRRRKASSWMVLPRPMSSARQPPNPISHMAASQATPRCW